VTDFEVSQLSRPKATVIEFEANQPSSPKVIDIECQANQPTSPKLELSSVKPTIKSQVIVIDIKCQVNHPVSSYSYPVSSLRSRLKFKNQVSSRHLANTIQFFVYSLPSFIRSNSFIQHNNCHTAQRCVSQDFLPMLFSCNCVLPAVF